MVGPPGSGKTMLARRLPGLLPELTLTESIAVTKVYSIAADEPPSGLMRHRPFRSPHTGISTAGLIGGGSQPRPGKATLAQTGVLFLDELPEFRLGILESLRQPQEEGHVKVVRAQARPTFPARFALEASPNPCPCGHLVDPRGQCHSPLHAVERYRSHLSGPLLGRIDLHGEVPPITLDDLEKGPSESTAEGPKRLPPIGHGKLAVFLIRRLPSSMPPWARIKCENTALPTPLGNSSWKEPSALSASPPALISES